MPPLDVHESLVLAPVLVMLAGGGEQPGTLPPGYQSLLGDFPCLGRFVTKAFGMAGICKFADALLYALDAYALGHDGPAHDSVAAFAAALHPDESSTTRELSIDQWEFDEGEWERFYNTFNAYAALYDTL